MRLFIALPARFAMVLVALLASRSADAFDMRRHMSNAAFVGIVGAIGNLNRAMRSAADNPQDTFRRKAVRDAVAALAPAIRALAMEYQAVKLPVREFPMVQAMLGGFVDQNAPKMYERFLMSPEARYIPAVGSSFPAGVHSTSGSQYPGAASAAVSNAGGGSSGGAGTGGTAQVTYDDRGAATKSPVDTTGFESRIQPRFWRLLPISLVTGALLPVPLVLAQEDDEESKNIGEQIAQVLFGVAAIIAAIAPMVVAGIQAGADVSIAGINAQTQVALTKITSDTSKELAVMQKDVALKQSEIAQAISNKNNAAVTQRLNLQLAELRDAREDARSAEQERRALEDSYNQQRIQLAKEQANQNLELAKQTLKAQLTQAGLTSGFGSSSNSGNSLTVNGAFNSGSAVGSSSPPADQALSRGVTMDVTTRSAYSALTTSPALGQSAPGRDVLTAQTRDAVFVTSDPRAPYLLGAGVAPRETNSTAASALLANVGHSTTSEKDAELATDGSFVGRRGRRLDRDDRLLRRKRRSLELPALPDSTKAASSPASIVRGSTSERKRLPPLGAAAIELSAP